MAAGESAEQAQPPSGPSAPDETEDGFQLAPSDLFEDQPLLDGTTLGIGNELSLDETADDIRKDSPLSARSLFGSVLADHLHYYSSGNLLALGAGVGVAAAIANTGADKSFRDFYQENVRDIHTDEYFEALQAPKLFGDGRVMLPLYGVTAVAGCLLDDRPVGRDAGDWGQRSLRTVLVGGPPMLLAQMATGAGRPGETHSGSGWTPFRDDNGVSGHSFMGAIPFLSAAKMTDSSFWKTLFYAGSTLPGISRINDDRHYASQVLLGWWMAYLAATAVDGKHWGPDWLSFCPLSIDDGMGFGVECRR